MLENIKDLNINIKINNIVFDIKDIDIEINTITMFGNHNNYVMPSPQKCIKISAETSNNNYIALNNWIESSYYSSIRNYKQDINYNGIFIGGIFPIDYTFNQYKINVTFSADYINGDFSLFKLKELRKEKLKRLNKICQNS